jgi:putative PIN family toxin of toxin-antitoxin system
VNRGKAEGRDVEEQRERPGCGPSPRLRRVVLDTNVLVGAAYNPGSASRRIVEACLRGDLLAVTSAALHQEYELILARAVRGRGDDRVVWQVLERAIVVEPARTPRVVPEDPADDKLVALALAAGADALVTNDRHLLTLDAHGPVRIVRPGDFLPP